MEGNQGISMSNMLRSALEHMRENTRTQVQCVTICSCNPIEMQNRLLGARETNK